MPSEDAFDADAENINEYSPAQESSRRLAAEPMLGMMSSWLRIEEKDRARYSGHAKY